jgi:DUF917 family protein
MLRQRQPWPLTVHDAQELSPATPAVAVGYAGSTYLMTERLPDTALFAPLLAAAERWTGQAARAVCSIEGGGMNGLTPFLLAPHLQLVDADFTGRALPRFDQMTMFVDEVPGLLACVSTGAGGVCVIEASRAQDVEALVRSAVVCAGGVGPVLIAGFTVGQLAEHAITGGLERALAVGRVDPSGPPAEVAAAVGGRYVGGGRVESVTPGVSDPYASSALMVGDDGTVLRLISHTEFLAVQRDGAVIASAPEVIVCLDPSTNEILEVQGIHPARRVEIFALPAPSWWSARPHRLAHVTPAAYGVQGLDQEGAACSTP